MVSYSQPGVGQSQLADMDLSVNVNITASICQLKMKAMGGGREDGSRGVVVAVEEGGGEGRRGVCKFFSDPHIKSALLLPVI